MISPSKKRLAITFDERTLKCMEEILALRDPQIHTYSKIVNTAVIYFYLVARGFAEPQIPEELLKGVNDNESN